MLSLCPALVEAQLGLHRPISAIVLPSAPEMTVQCTIMTVVVVVTLGMIAQIGIIFVNATCRTTAQGGIMNDVAVETSGIVVRIATHEVTALGAIIIIVRILLLIGPCDTTIVTPKTIIFVTITQGITIVICETMACIIALVLTVEIGVSPMPW
jgi:hypothetical protein